MGFRQAVRARLGYAGPRTVVALELSRLAVASKTAFVQFLYFYRVVAAVREPASVSGLFFVPVYP